MNRFRLALSFVIGLIVICDLSDAAHAVSTTIRYTGHISSVDRNEIDFLVPLGDPVSVEITFDPFAPDLNATTNWGFYQMSGGDTNFQIRIGPYQSVPIQEYSITVVDEMAGGTNDQYNFLNLQGNDLLTIDFPGFLEGARTALFFRLRNPPITSDSLFLSQPNPIDFQDTRLTFGIREAGDLVLHFTATLDPLLIPEPGTATLGLIALWVIFADRRKHWSGANLACRMG